MKKKPIKRVFSPRKNLEGRLCLKHKVSPQQTNIHLLIAKLVPHVRLETRNSVTYKKVFLRLLFSARR